MTVTPPTPRRPKRRCRPRLSGASGGLIDQLKQPPALYVTVLAVVSTALMLVFLVLWRMSAGAASDEK